MSKPTITFSGPRAEEWERVLGVRTLAIKSPSAKVCKLEGSPDELCVMLDLDALSKEQEESLAIHMAAKFGGRSQDVLHAIQTMGVPIRLGSDTEIDIPPDHKAPRKSDLLGGPNAWDLRFFN